MNVLIGNFNGWLTFEVLITLFPIPACRRRFTGLSAEPSVGSSVVVFFLLYKKFLKNKYFV